MRQLNPLFLLAMLVGLVVPAGAHAGALDAVRAAKLQSAAGTLSITETRCAPGSSDCGRVTLTTKFESGAPPRTRRTRGHGRFPLGVRVSGRGSGQCSAESPPVIVTAPDGSMQLLDSAQRVDPVRFDATRIFIGARRRGARWAWQEPLAPGFTCRYFDERGTALALPASAALPTSGWIARRLLRRSHFSVTIAGTQTWSRHASDGAVVTGHARWRLRLRYAR